MIKDEAHNYWYPLAEKLCGGDQIELEKLLGVDEYTVYAHRPYSEDVPMKDDLRELLIKLQGPHYRAILKAYRIRKGLE